MSTKEETVEAERNEGLAARAGSAEPMRMSYSREEALDQARMWMVYTYGSPRELVMDEREKFHQRLGMLVDFIDVMFPAASPNHSGSPTPEVKR